MQIEKPFRILQKFFTKPFQFMEQFVLTVRYTNQFRWKVNCFMTESFVQSYLDSPRSKDESRLLRSERKVYSQSGEDGIIAEVFRRVGTSSRRFVEIGAGDGLENNTVWLLLQGWSGAWIEPTEISKKFDPFMASGRLTVLNMFATAEAVQRLEREGFFAGIDLLSLDIDGNDYHILAALEKLEARLVIVEYNAKFPPPHKFIMKYDPDKSWDMTDDYGASLAAWDELLQTKGYSLVACSIGGVNAFFVRNDLLAGKFCEPLTPENHYEPARHWLTFVSGYAPNIGEGHFFDA